MVAPDAQNGLREERDEVLDDDGREGGICTPGGARIQNDLLQQHQEQSSWCAEGDGVRRGQRAHEPHTAGPPETAGGGRSTTGVSRTSSTSSRICALDRVRELLWKGYVPHDAPLLKDKEGIQPAGTGLQGAKEHRSTDPSAGKTWQDPEDIIKHLYQPADGFLDCCITGTTSLGNRS